MVSLNESVVVIVVVVTDIYDGKYVKLELLGSLSVVFRGATVRHLVTTKSRMMSKFSRVTSVTIKLG